MQCFYTFRKVNETICLVKATIIIIIGFTNVQNTIWGQMWLAEAFNLARTALIFVLLSFYIETPFEGVKTYCFGP